MSFTTLLTLLIAAVPSVTSIIAIVCAVIKNLKANAKTKKEIIDAFETLKQEVIDTKEYEELKYQLHRAYEENRLLRKRINELLTAIDKIIRPEEK